MKKLISIIVLILVFITNNVNAQLVSYSTEEFDREVKLMVSEKLNIDNLENTIEEISYYENQIISSKYVNKVLKGKKVLWYDKLSEIFLNKRLEVTNYKIETEKVMNFYNTQQDNINEYYNTLYTIKTTDTYNLTCLVEKKCEKKVMFNFLKNIEKVKKLEKEIKNAIENL